MRGRAPRTLGDALVVMAPVYLGPALAGLGALSWRLPAVMAGAGALIWLSLPLPRPFEGAGFALRLFGVIVHSALVLASYGVGLGFAAFLPLPAISPWIAVFVFTAAVLFAVWRLQPWRKAPAPTAKARQSSSAGSDLGSAVTRHLAALEQEDPAGSLAAMQFLGDESQRLAVAPPRDLSAALALGLTAMDERVRREACLVVFALIAEGTGASAFPARARLGQIARQFPDTAEAMAALAGHLQSRRD